MSEFNSLTASELGDLIGKGEIDPVELINTQRGDMVEYNYISTKTERTFYSVEVKCGRVSLAKTRKGVTANKRYYIPVHDVNCKYLVPSKKRHR